MGLPKKCNNLVCAAHQNYKLALNLRGFIQSTIKSAIYSQGNQIWNIKLNIKISRNKN